MLDSQSKLLPDQINENIMKMLKIMTESSAHSTGAF